MQSRIGYALSYDCPQPTPMILMLHVHSPPVCDYRPPGPLLTDPRLPICAYPIVRQLVQPHRAAGRPKRGLVNRRADQRYGEARRSRPGARRKTLSGLCGGDADVPLGSRICEKPITVGDRVGTSSAYPQAGARVQAFARLRATAHPLDTRCTGRRRRLGRSMRKAPESAETWRHLAVTF